MEASAYALNADRLDGRDASEFLDTSPVSQTKVGDLYVGNLTVGGVLGVAGGSVDLGPSWSDDLTASDVTMLTSGYEIDSSLHSHINPDPPCFLRFGGGASWIAGTGR